MLRLRRTANLAAIANATLTSAISVAISVTLAIALVVRRTVGLATCASCGWFCPSSPELRHQEALLQRRVLRRIHVEALRPPRCTRRLHCLHCLHCLRRPLLARSIAILLVLVLVLRLCLAIRTIRDAILRTALASLQPPPPLLLLLLLLPPRTERLARLLQTRDEARVVLLLQELRRLSYRQPQSLHLLPVPPLHAAQRVRQCVSFPRHLDQLRLHRLSPQRAWRHESKRERAQSGPVGSASPRG